MLFGEKSSYPCPCCHGDTVCSCHSCGTVTTHPKPHLNPEQTSLFLLLPFSVLSLPYPCVYLVLHLYHSLHLPHPPPSSPVWSLTVYARSYSVQLTNVEQEDRRNSTDDHTLSLAVLLSTPTFLTSLTHWGQQTDYLCATSHPLPVVCGTPRSVSLRMYIWWWALPLNCVC